MIKVAYNISNLSDARYFAAFGFDWLIFEDRGNEMISQIMEIINWVSGLKIGIMISDQDRYLHWLNSEVKFEGIWLEDSFQNIAIDPELVIFTRDSEAVFNNQIVYQICANTNHSTWNDRSLIDLSALEIGSVEPNLILQNHIGGICIAGDEEIKSGLKSYSNQEYWMDFLEALENLD